MKNQFKAKLFLVISMLPMSNLAIAASARYSQLEDEIQNEKVIKSFISMRKKIMPSKATTTTIEDALIHFQKATGLEGEDLKSAFENEINLLLLKKSILINGKGVIGGAPSFV